MAQLDIMERINELERMWILNRWMSCVSKSKKEKN